MTTSSLGTQSTEVVRSGETKSQLGTQSTEIVVGLTNITSQLGSQSVEVVVEIPGIKSQLGSQSIEVITLLPSEEIPEPEPPEPIPVLDVDYPLDRSVYLDLVAKDNPLAGWMPGRYIEENNADQIQVIKNYYGERIKMPLISPYDPGGIVTWP